MNIQPLIDITKDLPNKDKLAIAGGSILDLVKDKEPKDYDIFFNDYETQDSVVAFLRQNAELLSETDKLVKFMYKGYPLELVLNRFYDLTTTELIDSFDFTICQAQFVNGKLTMCPTYWQDVLKTELVLNKVTFAAHTLKRATRYAEKGYSLSNKDYETLKNQPESNFYSRFTGLVNPTQQEVKESFLDDVF